MAQPKKRAQWTKNNNKMMQKDILYKLDSKETLLWYLKNSITKLFTKNWCSLHNTHLNPHQRWMSIFYGLIRITRYWDGKLICVNYKKAIRSTTRLSVILSKNNWILKFTLRFPISKKKRLNNHLTNTIDTQSHLIFQTLKSQNNMI